MDVIQQLISGGDLGLLRLCNNKSLMNVNCNITYPNGNYVNINYLRTTNNQPFNSQVFFLIFVSRKNTFFMNSLVNIITAVVIWYYGMNILNLHTKPPNANFTLTKFSLLYHWNATDETIVFVWYLFSWEGFIEFYKNNFLGNGVNYLSKYNCAI